MDSWNLSSQNFSDIHIIQISLSEQFPGEKVSENLRILILSHQLSQFGIPSFYLESSPSYSLKRINSPVVISFDIYSKRSEFILPNWTDCQEWDWNVLTYFSFEISDHFSRALVLFTYYQKLNLHPIYFTSYLLIPPQRSVIEPFLFQPVVVKRKDKIYIRTVLQGGLEISIINSPKSIGSMVLIPPFEHPFKVVEILSKSFDVISVEKKKYSFKIPTKIANLTKPPLLLASFFYVEQVFKPISNLDLVEFDRFTIEDINKCFTDMNLSSNRTPSNQYPTDFLEPPEPSTSQILSEQITDFNVRLRIAQALGEQAQFPSKRASLKCIVTNFLSYFRLEVGFSTVIPPRSAYSFLNNSPIQHVQLGIPNILVNHNGFLEEVKASSVIDNWISEHYLPISGPKDCKYVVFSPNTIPRTLLISFMKSFMHTYNMFGFGKLQPYSSNAYYFVPENSIDSTAIEFYQNNPLSQFQQIPFITFIVGYPFHDSDFLPHSIVTNIFPPLVYSCTQLGLQSLAFIVYSRIRLFSPTPIGMINTIQNYAVPIIFGFRYQPPFLLPRYGTNSRSISFHFALDIKTNKCAIIDDIGSILHILNLNSLQYLSALIDDCKKLVEQNVSQITVSILSEGLTENFLNDFKNIIPNVLLFSVFPSSCVQGKFENDFDSDTIIFDELEQSFSSDEVLVDPIETCYVLSKIHPPYKVSLYAAGDRNDLLNYVELMSKLSWLSVKPGEEKRTISYPPHICALLRKNRCETIVLSRFEFLPSNGPI